MITKEQITASEKAIEDYLAASATASVEKSAKTVTLESLMAEIESLKTKSLGGNGDPASPDAPEPDAEDADADEDEDEAAADTATDVKARAQFLAKSLREVEASAEGKGSEAMAIDITRWLDGFASVVKSLHKRYARVERIEKSIKELSGRTNLLVMLQGAQLQKSLDDAATTKSQPAGRASTLSVLHAPAGGGTPGASLATGEGMIDGQAIPPPHVIKSLALRAQRDGKLDSNAVCKIEAQINGVPGFEAPVLPDAGTMRMLMSYLNNTAAA